MNTIQALKTSLTCAVARVWVRGPLARIESEVNEHRSADILIGEPTRGTINVIDLRGRPGLGTRASGPH